MMHVTLHKSVSDLPGGRAAGVQVAVAEFGGDLTCVFIERALGPGLLFTLSQGRAQSLAGPDSGSQNNMWE